MFYPTNVKVQEKRENRFLKENIENFRKVIKDIFSKDKQKIQKQIPNILTLIRGIIGPIIIIQALTCNNLYLAIVLIGICAMTDFFDGWYARKYNAKSEFGALLDTICDKIFAISIVVPIISISPEFIVCILTLEIVIAFINSYFELKGYNTSSSMIGKVKTAILYITILFYYLSCFVNIKKYILNIISTVTIFMQVVAAIDYFRRYRKQELV